MPGLPRIAADALRGGARHRYADHRWGVCELHVPRGAGPYPVAVVLHGGSWRAGYDRRVMRPVCRDLVRRGWAAWNMEYRRVGGGQDGGWPATFEDVAAGVDALAGADPRLDLRRVVLLGHSAGGHLALWAAGRPQLPAGAPGAGPQVLPRAVVAQAPVANLERARALVEPGGAVNALLGGITGGAAASGTRSPTRSGRSRSPFRRCSSTALTTARSPSARAATTRRPPAPREPRSSSSSRRAHAIATTWTRAPPPGRP